MPPIWGSVRTRWLSRPWMYQREFSGKQNLNGYQRQRFHQKKNRSIIDKPPGTEEIPLVTDVSQGSSQWLPSRVSGRGRKPRQGPTHANTRPKAPGMAAIGATRGQKGALARQQRLLHATVSSFNCKPPEGICSDMCLTLFIIQYSFWMNSFFDSLWAAEVIFFLAPTDVLTRFG